MSRLLSQKMRPLSTHPLLSVYEEYLEKGIQDEILLPVKKGRQVIYDMVKSGICIIYKFRSKEEEEVMQKLYDFKTGEGQKS